MAENEEAAVKTNKSPWESVTNLLPTAAVVLTLLGSLAVGIRSPAISVKQLTVVGSFVQAGDRWEISGRVLQDGDAIGRVLVWAIVDYANGQHASPASTQTDDRGGFSVGPVTTTFGSGNRDIARATIYARKEIPGAWFPPKTATTLRGEDNIRPAGAAVLETAEIVGLSPLVLAPMIAIFLISAMLPFFGQETPRKYLAAIVLAFCFTGFMIVYLSLGLRYVITEGKSKETLQLGFASIYRSTYVKDVQPEWVFSFTAPPRLTDAPSSETTPAPQSTMAAPLPQGTVKRSPTPAVPKSGVAAATLQTGGITGPKVQPDTVAIDHGFGAPLWVLLVSVIGASVVTVGLMVDEIAKAGEITVTGPDVIRKHIYAFVQHEFFILFAPVTAIFVYQTLVAGSAATSAFTVGLAALGAGPALSALLTKAGAAATKLFG